MYKKSPQGWLKHWDFLLIDILALQLSFVFAYTIYLNELNMYIDEFYASMSIVFLLVQILITFLAPNYKDILSRGYYIEFLKVFQNTVYIFAVVAFYLFISKQGELFSRGTFLIMVCVNIVLTYLLRLWRKKVVTGKESVRTNGTRSLILISDRESVKKTIEKLRSKSYGAFEITGIVLVDGNTDSEIEGIKVVSDYAHMNEYICREWVDEVLISCSLPENELNQLVNDFVLMGITVHIGLPVLTGFNTRSQVVETMGEYTVFTTSINMVAPKQMMMKRLMDILGGIVGCVITGFVFLFIAPIIYRESPGPIFFTQTRIGKNGRQFKIYKFRSMYMDAEQRKAELMEQNKVKDGLMFKMDNDPRIIGSEKVRKDGTPGGIGNFIRRTSLDEFPQFLNVLKGDMSLVGTRPPTLDEWNQYELHHRARMAIKPGITGMWQANGRSEITDFEEVVKLDLDYIKNWSIGLDIKILLQTVLAVINKKGAE